MTNESSDEQLIASEVVNLWRTYTELRSAGRASTPERKLLHLSLGHRLDNIKCSLAHRGRNGRWSKFLFSCGIDRSSADRAVRAYRRTLGVGDAASFENPVPAVGLGQLVPPPMPANEVASEPVSAQPPAVEMR